MPEPTRGPGRIAGGLLYRFADSRHVLEVQRGYVRFFQEANPAATGSDARRVLDLGCGRGLFLGLLTEAGLEAEGVDQSAEAVEECRRQGFPGVHHADVFDFVGEQVATGRTFGGIFCSHLIEHLPADAALRLVDLIGRALAPGGRVVLVTPNVENGEVWSRTFWLDLGHQRPYPRPILEAMLEAAGLEVVASFDDPRTRRPYFWRDWRRLLPDLLRYGSSALLGMDAVVVGERSP